LAAKGRVRMCARNSIILQDGHRGWGVTCVVLCRPGKRSFFAALIAWCVRPLCTPRCALFARKSTRAPASSRISHQGSKYIKKMWAKSVSKRNSMKYYLLNMIFLYFYGHQNTASDRFSAFIYQTETILRAGIFYFVGSKLFFGIGLEHRSKFSITSVFSVVFSTKYSRNKSRNDFNFPLGGSGKWVICFGTIGKPFRKLGSLLASGTHLVLGPARAAQCKHTPS
jgi:hypothetical protein